MSSSLQVAPPLAPNEIRIANKYRLGRKIGAGSFGDIYLGSFYSSSSYLVDGYLL
jgi:hypothetical protein